MSYSGRKLGGLLLLVGGIQWILAVIVAEARYLNYSVANNFISDLGVDHSSALIFNGSTFLLGVLIVAAAYSLRREFGSFFTISLALAGIGPLGVGIFNETHILLHSVFALTAFIFGAVTATYTGRFIKGPLSYVSVAVGAFVFLALVLFLSDIRLGVGIGGMERMVAYPTTLWMIGLGGYLLADLAGPAERKR